MYRKILYLYIVVCCLAFAGSEQYPKEIQNSSNLIAYTSSEPTDYDLRYLQENSSTSGVHKNQEQQPVNRSFTIDSSSAEDLVTIGAILCDAGRQELGVSLINEGVTIDAKAALFFKSAEIYKELKQFDKAIEDCDKAFTLDFTNVGILLLKAELLQLLHKYDEAIALYDTILMIWPNQIQTRFERARLHAMMKNDSQAMEDISAFLDEEPTNTEAYFIRAEILRRVHQFEYAITDYKTIYSIDSSHFNVTYEMALTYAELHQPDSVKHYMDLFIEKSLGREAFNSIMQK